MIDTNPNLSKKENIFIVFLMVILMCFTYYFAVLDPISNQDLVQLEQDLSSLSESEKSKVLGETLDDDIIREREKDKIYERLDKLKAEHAIENLRNIKE